MNSPDDRRLDLVETDLRDLRANQRTDFRWTWGGLITAFLITWAGLGGGIIWLGLHILSLEAKLTGIEVALSKLIH
jgi:hypothetical protein